MRDPYDLHDATIVLYVADDTKVTDLVALETGVAPSQSPPKSLCVIFCGDALSQELVSASAHPDIELCRFLESLLFPLNRPDQGLAPRLPWNTHAQDP